jgi:hypothetical protein
MANDYNQLEHNITLSKKIQWQYEKCPNEWKDFSIYINSFSLKKSLFD